jgi:hypothetical protein
VRVGLSTTPRLASKSPAVRENSRKTSRPHPKSTGIAADKALSIRDLEETRWRFAGDVGSGFLHAKKHAGRGLAAELERVAILGLHRHQSRGHRAAFQAEGVTFFTGTTLD